MADYSARRLKPGSYELEIEPLASAHARPCWESSKNPNFRSLILDPIEVTLGPYTGGAQVCNLLAHQETYAAGPPLAIPDSARALVRRIWGRRRNPGFEQFHEPLDFYQRQLALNLDLSQRRRLLFHELIRGNDFDLLVVGINLHDIVHLLWPFQEGRDDPRDPHRQLAHGVRTAYEEADREIGEIQKLLPPDSTEVLLSLYGVRDQYPTQELSQRLLELLGYQVPFTGDGVSWSPLGVARHLLPESLRFQISALLPDRLQQSLLRSGFARSMDFRRSRAFVVPTGLFSSHIRVNLKGREPTGCVAPGRDYEELINDLERQFRALIDPVTGKPAVASVLRTANEFIDGPSPISSCTGNPPGISCGASFIPRGRSPSAAPTSSATPSMVRRASPPSGGRPSSLPPPRTAPFSISLPHSCASLANHLRPPCPAGIPWRPDLCEFSWSATTGV